MSMKLTKFLSCQDLVQDTLNCDFKEATREGKIKEAGCEKFVFLEDTKII